MNDVDHYISKFPVHVQEILSKIRNMILQKVPEAEEKISYGMPGYYLNGKPLVYFAAFKNHIGFYATPNGHEKFTKELAVYKQGKGSVQFPLDEEIPYQLIVDIVKFRSDKIQNQ
ncbi:iron chaperone [Chryseobacterium sp.]|uniref:iron chaperone n=1 Tax=Chryseobacterium sp. TaxID=1871047 RepID=UPI0011C9573E|nr:DUF1801 domain-containing protein [Chryseobacterium sp.]TXF78932.1 DUF1801 domain-containing protein [Chryseobacterium sp.]